MPPGAWTHVPALRRPSGAGEPTATPSQGRPRRATETYACGPPAQATVFSSPGAPLPGRARTECGDTSSKRAFLRGSRTARRGTACSGSGWVFAPIARIFNRNPVSIPSARRALRKERRSVESTRNRLGPRRAPTTQLARSARRSLGRRSQSRRQDHARARRSLGHESRGPRGCSPPGRDVRSTLARNVPSVLSWGGPTSSPPSQDVKNARARGCVRRSPTPP